MSNRITIIAILTLLLTSCFKKDEMIPAHEPGEITTVVIPLTRYYTNQVYFDLRDNEITSINDRSLFDLNFNCNDTSTIIRLNTANFALAAETMFKNLNDVVDTIGLTWRFDKSDGNPDSLAIDNWISIDGVDTSYNNKVWVINRGINPLGLQLGFIKIKFSGILGDRYFFTYSNMDNSGLVDAYVDKNELYSYIQYSFTEERVTQTEPEIVNWDLLFTQYTTLLYTDEGLSYPYLVTGVLQKYNNFSVALDTTLAFSEVILADTTEFNYSGSLDKIGYNWKVLTGDVNTGDIYYEVKLNNTYLIKDRNLFYYKLRFVNFYDPITGEKGYPTFEYQQL